MKSFSSEILTFLIQKVLGLLRFGSCQNCKSSTNPVAEIHQKLWNERVLSSEEPCTCEYATLPQSFHRGTLSIHCYITQNFQSTFSMVVLLKRSFKTVIFSRLLKVAIASPNFMIEVYNGGFASEFSVSMLKQTIPLV